MDRIETKIDSIIGHLNTPVGSNNNKEVNLFSHRALARRPKRPKKWIQVIRNL